MLSTLKKSNCEQWFSSDNKFDSLYPLSIQLLSKRHWTPLGIARKAAKFLATHDEVRILDIGSGAGKFCLAAAYYEPRGLYHGIEQRKNLIEHADAVRAKLELKNISFINGNFTKLDFADFDHFYFFNSFYENLAGTDKIDSKLLYSVELYNYYNRYLYNLLEQRPSGTRLVTYHSLEDEIPPNYHEVGAELDNLLKFWIKE